MAADVPTLVGVYRQTFRAPLRRVWENVYDWEHLPWLHSSTSAAIELGAEGAWGGRARIALQPSEPRRELLLELVAERAAGGYVARTPEGAGAGTESWTRLEPKGGRTAIEVEFHVPGLAGGATDAVGAALARTCARLRDEVDAHVGEVRLVPARPEPGPRGGEPCP